MKTLTLASRLAGGVWGHLVGDATGVPYEFTPASAIGTVEFGAQGGPWRQPPGTWSDDGALMLALLDSLLTVGFDPGDQGRRAVAWMEDGTYTPDRDGRFDIGNTTATALGAIGRGVPAVDAGPTDEHASSNGSLMRILPLALVERDGGEGPLVERGVDDGPLVALRADDAMLIAHAHAASRVTHGHVRCQVACALYALVVRRLLHGEESDPALRHARLTLRGAYRADPPAVAHLAALDELEAWTGRGGRGHVFDAFWSAWDAFAGARSYPDAIVRAIRYGNDTDTTAAIAGGLAGVHFGWQAIPTSWRRGMRGREVATPLVDRLVATTGARTSTTSPLRVDAIDLHGADGIEAGSLGITFLPGKKRDGYTGPHWRDVELDADTLCGRGVRVLFLLVEDIELDWCMVPELVDVLTAAGIELVRFPIRDPRIPTRGQEAGFRLAVADLVARLCDGQSIAIACRGGIDRSGMTAACILVEAGLPAQEAIDRVHAGRKGSLTYREQVRYVRGWGETGGGRGRHATASLSH
jgi:ADP-ribosylglycohydrolase/protein-tyrosine phosphatase